MKIGAAAFLLLVCGQLGCCGSLDHDAAVSLMDLLRTHRGRRLTDPAHLLGGERAGDVSVVLSASFRYSERILGAIA